MQLQLIPRNNAAGAVTQVDICSTTPDHRSGSSFLAAVTSMHHAHDWVIKNWLSRLPAFQPAMNVPSKVNLVTGVVTLDLTEALAAQKLYDEYTGPF